ncbi:MAG: DUF4339 domain-containing protein, partial [Candidatus Delongbacteria bacterium]|nr:DUF4339 domain-containing protein [Candidatus Delongbacteria bacterium]
PMPPPIPPSPKFFIVLNGQQDGPYDTSVLKNMTIQKMIDQDTLVWREGMTNWTPAKDVPEFNGIFAGTPPPIPGA